MAITTDEWVVQALAVRWRRRIDRRGLKGRVTLAEAHHDASGQESHEQQKRPAGSPQEHTSRPKPCPHSRGHYCVGVEKYTPEVESTAWVHGGADFRGSAVLLP